ncbi:FMN-linked oxidoreductase [Wallemia mellicola]|uniref:FMN-linked oxidoreductase n=1 Tax=Wallemia mellicola TaxID=1708541 RepID=A0A4T0UBM7_9BASI|nr:FMN-linked oxidoreductase [Wallemia mellicola]TIC01835.1 FMN-linked oxidoreductase [Wallemia mellicola]TIC03121.1 FMN-linked oxidoreductase [Wallemia mellicola]TIC75677.1 FMN-linked oxidoreductase [Wallemia mellicola]
MSSSCVEGIELKCGLKLKNRFVKSALEESLCRLGGSAPTAGLIELYRKWDKGGYGMIITGNIQVDAQYIGLPFDACMSYDDNDVNQWKSLIEGVRDTPLIVQLNHPGAQSPRWTLSKSPLQRNLAPSNVNHVFPSNMMFPDSEEMSEDDIQTVIKQFVIAAKYLHEMGINGVQIHGSHGYMISQFLSPKTNRREDVYGNDRTKIVVEIINQIRHMCGKDFCIGVKLNSSDYLKGGMTMDDALQNYKDIVTKTTVDFVEISGGNYDSLVFLARSSEVFFEEFAKRIRDEIEIDEDHKPALMLTGGIRKRDTVDGLIKQNVCNLVGLGRPACVDMKIPQKMLSDEEFELDLSSYEVDNVLGFKTLGFVGASVRTLAYTLHLHRLARGDTSKFRGFLTELLLEIYRVIPKFYMLVITLIHL